MLFTKKSDVNWTISDLVEALDWLESKTGFREVSISFNLRGDYKFIIETAPLSTDEEAALLCRLDKALNGEIDWELRPSSRNNV